MLAPACDAIREHIEANYQGTWPLRWPNEDWVGGINPVASMQPFIECEIIGGLNRLVGFGMFGQRTFVHPGILRLYFAVPISSGMGEALATADVFSVFLERTEFGRNGTEAVRTQDFSTYGGAAAIEEGSFTVLAASVGFEFYYQG